MAKVVIIMGSKADLEWSEKIKSASIELGMEAECYVASAHKVPLVCYDLIKKEEKNNVVFVTVAGMSNALSGFSDAQTYCPVIACPPIGNSFGGADVYSSLRMPSGVAAMTVLSPANAALAAAKMFALTNNTIRTKVAEYQEKQRQKLIDDNASIQ